MPHILIIHSSRHGHTERVARRLAGQLPDCDTAVASVAEAGAVDPSGFDGIVVCGSIHMAHHDGRLLDWVRAHRHALRREASAFVSVSLAAIGDPETARRYADEFLEAADWSPRRILTLAGALQYPAYGLPTRLLVRQIARKKDLSTDVSRTTEYTDWGELERFAGQFAEDLRVTRSEFAVSAR
jgi:menaquinone-dependent protoporphyrinogen oxidase